MWQKIKDGFIDFIWGKKEEKAAEPVKQPEPIKQEAVVVEAVKPVINAEVTSTAPVVEIKSKKTSKKKATINTEKKKGGRPKKSA